MVLGVGLSLFAASLLSTSALAQSGRSGPNAGPRTEGAVTKGTAQKPPLQLTDAQKQQVLRTLMTQNTLDKAPEGFTP